MNSRIDGRHYYVFGAVVLGSPVHRCRVDLQNTGGNVDQKFHCTDMFRENRDGDIADLSRLTLQHCSHLLVLARDPSEHREEEARQAALVDLLFALDQRGIHKVIADSRSQTHDLHQGRGKRTEPDKRDLRTFKNHYPKEHPMRLSHANGATTPVLVFADMAAYCGRLLVRGIADERVKDVCSRIEVIRTRK